MKTAHLFTWVLCLIIIAVANCEVEEKDLYGTLGIDRDASQRDIKKAFRKLSRKYNPDKNPGDEEAAQKFNDIAEAYEILSDQEQKFLYDDGGMERVKGEQQGGGQGKLRRHLDAQETTTPVPLWGNVVMVKSCWSVGMTHTSKFNGNTFYSNTVGWNTLYAKGALKIQVERAIITTTPDGTATLANRAVRYSTDGDTWAETLENGRLLSSGKTKVFTNPNVQLTVESSDYSHFSWAQVDHIYKVYVATNEDQDATGQCTQGKLRRSTDMVTFPSSNVKVSKQHAELACAGLGDQKENCVTDIRVVNDPDAVAQIRADFDQAESTLHLIRLGDRKQGQIDYPDYPDMHGFL